MKLAKTYPIRLLCRLLDAPRSSAYYEPNQASDHNVYKVALLDLAAEYPTYGYRRLTVMLKRAGHPANAKRVRRWMHELNLAATPPARKVRTTDSRHGFPRYDNAGERLRRAADADYQGEGGGPVGVRGLRRCPAADRPVHRRRVQRQADPFAPRLSDAQGVRDQVDKRPQTR